MADKGMQRLALFDFDGTLTCKDTLPEIVRFIHGRRRFYLGLLRLLPILFLFKIRLIPNWKAKEKLLIYFFHGMPYALFQQKCNRFTAEKLPILLKTDTVNALIQHKREGARIIIVTASVENWVAPWCEELGITCIATRMEVKDGKLTGRIEGKNCYGMEKVDRIRQTINLSAYAEIYAYGDSKGDLPMLRLATHSFLIS